MPTWRIVLRPKSSVAVWLSSDTLFGALCWAIRQVEGRDGLSRWLQNGSPQWLLSSAFPFVDGATPLWFFPMPLALLPTAKDVTEVSGHDRSNQLKAMEQTKRLNKIAYLSETLFAQALRGNLNARTLLAQAIDKKGQLTTIGNCLLTKEEAARLERIKRGLWKSADVQHTAVDRVGLSAAEGLLFFDTEHFFAPCVGLFFLLRCPADFPLRAAFRFLAHGGLGGNRFVGKGWFNITCEPADEWLAQLEPKGDNARAIVLLSQCVPHAGEFDWSKSVYRLLTKRPKFESAYGQPQQVYKGIIRMMAEGSVLVPHEFKPAYGRLIRVGEATDWDGSAYHVFHNGLGFPLRMVVPNAMA